MPSEYRYKAQIRKSNKVHMKVNTTQALTRVQPPDTKTGKSPVGKMGTSSKQPNAGAVTSGG